MKKKTKIIIIRWVAIILLTGLTLHLINYAFFAAWVSGGPPNNYPEAWAYMSVKSLYFGVCAGLFTVIAFLAIGKDIGKIKKIICYAMAISACLAFIFPFGYKQMKIDSCLDSGGKWEEKTFMCIK